jgi:hypothetical protein
MSFVWRYLRVGYSGVSGHHRLLGKVLPERVAFDMLAPALFALLPSCAEKPLSGADRRGRRVSGPFVRLPMQGLYDAERAFRIQHQGQRLIVFA